ncbi:DUF1418 family protein [Listeria grandensis]|uniref:DUF1418 family protein n=1 Tax=Listeria grandensis TaxID=1494963 RepID=A0A7X0Y2B4_9LIST|nr:DUF1418 family protein [Listeria grandensis]MBC1473295.1 DUF1418 family protein [Listeria grandensis]MBC1935314.1 DUF1418 family protein [Listeria grandensis]
MKDNTALIAKRSKIALIVTIIGLILSVLVQISTFINLGKSSSNPLYNAMMSMTYIGIFFMIIAVVGLIFLIKKSYYKAGLTLTITGIACAIFVNPFPGIAILIGGVIVSNVDKLEKGER